ncbi:MAG: ExbD/TolR family protein [Opitutales bacterium]
MITRPLDLESRLSRPPRDLDVFFWVNLAAVALFFTLMGSRFVLAPGQLVQVGQTPGELPQITSAAPGAASVVVSYRRDNMVIFDGGIHELRDLRQPMETYVRKHPGSVLLVRVDRQVSMQGFLDLCDLARKAGFIQVLVAAEPHENEPAPLTPAVR